MTPGERIWKILERNSAETYWTPWGLGKTWDRPTNLRTHSKKNRTLSRCWVCWLKSTVITKRQAYPCTLLPQLVLTQDRELVRPQPPGETKTWLYYYKPDQPLVCRSTILHSKNAIIWSDLPLIVMMSESLLYSRYRQSPSGKILCRIATWKWYTNVVKKDQISK